MKELIADLKHAAAHDAEDIQELCSFAAKALEEFMEDNIRLQKTQDAIRRLLPLEHYNMWTDEDELR